MRTKRQGISAASTRGEKIKCLMPHFNFANLKQCFYELANNKAVGIDGISKEEYGKNLDANIEDLITRLKGLSYKPKPARQVLIPKSNGKTRPLSIPSIEDKIVQLMFKKTLEAIYEPIFLDCSHGFRPNRSAHDAVRRTREFLRENTTSHVIDVDLENFFGEIPHNKLLALLEMKISDKRYIRYINRLLKSGVMIDHTYYASSKGSGQGSIVSPILANIYAHYCIDKWFTEEVTPRLDHRAKLVRYADDLCIFLNKEIDIPKVQLALEGRLKRFDLRINQEKSRTLILDKHKFWISRQPTFDFLGFTFYLGVSRNGRCIPMVKTSSKKLRSALKEINLWMKANRSKLKLSDLHQNLCAKLRGHLQYFAVTFNSRAISVFIHHAKLIFFKWINRRSQKRSMNWKKFQLFDIAHPLPQPRISHRLF